MKGSSKVNGKATVQKCCVLTLALCTQPAFISLHWSRALLNQVYTYICHKYNTIFKFSFKHVGNVTIHQMFPCKLVSTILALFAGKKSVYELNPKATSLKEAWAVDLVTLASAFWVVKLVAASPC